VNFWWPAVVAVVGTVQVATIGWASVEMDVSAE